MVPQVKAKWIDAGLINEKDPKELCPVFPSSTVPGYQDLPRVADNPTPHGALSGRAALVGIILFLVLRVHLLGSFLSKSPAPRDTALPACLPAIGHNGLHGNRKHGSWGLSVAVGLSESSPAF